MFRTFGLRYHLLLYLGGVALYFIAICYLFLGISIVCDDYFVKSLEWICEDFNIPGNIAGATFMAAGSSAPEFFTSLVAITNDNADNEIGVSTIVGSAVFNILCIIGLTALCTEQTLTLDYRPIARDCSFYAAAIGTILVVFFDGKIYWWEGLIFVALYILYVLSLWIYGRYSSSEEAQPRRLESIDLFDSIIFDFENQCSAPLIGSSRTPIRERSDLSCPYEAFSSNSSQDASTDLPIVKIQSLSNSQNDAEEPSPTRKWLLEKTDQLYWFLSLPWSFVFSYSIPDCEKVNKTLLILITFRCCQENWKRFYMLTFLNSVIWIGAISWFMVEWTSAIGCTLGIPSIVMGVSVLAVGTSLPDALSSMQVAREGKADMAIANAIGSNVFDIWLGLGLPWLLVIPFKGEHGAWGRFIQVDTNQLIGGVCTLFGVLAIYVLFFVMVRWKLKAQYGYLFVFLYIVYALFNIIAVGILHIFDAGAED